MTETQRSRAVAACDAAPPSPAGPEGHAVLARNAMYLLAAQGLSTALAVALNAALGRTLGAADFGLFVLASSLAGFAYVVLEWGQTQYVVREIAQHPEREGRLLGSTLVVRVAGVVFMFGITAATAWALGYDARTLGLSVLFVAAMLPFFLAQAVSLVFRARERMEFDALTAVVDRVLTLAVTLAVLWLGAGVAGAAAGVGAGGLAALGVAILVLRHVRVSELSAGIDEAWAMLAGGFAIMIANVESSTQPYLDAIILSKLTPSEVVGWYGAARSFTGTLVAPAIILSVAAYPRLSRAAIEKGQLRRELRAVMRPLLALAVLGSVGTFLFAQPAVDLVFGHKGFSPAGAILRLLAPSLLLFFIDNMLGVAVVAAGRPAPLAFAKLVNIAVCAGLALWWVPLFQTSQHNGGLGLAIATGVAELVMLAAGLLILPRGSLDPSLLLDLVRALGAGAVTLLSFRLLPQLPLFVGIPLCVAAFGGLSVVLRLVQPAEVRALVQALFRRGTASR